MTYLSAYFLVIFKAFLVISAIFHTRKGRASIRGPDDIKDRIGVCFYWKRASIGEFRVFYGPQLITHKALGAICLLSLFKYDNNLRPILVWCATVFQVCHTLLLNDISRDYSHQELSGLKVPNNPIVARLKTFPWKTKPALIDYLGTVNWVLSEE